MKGIDVRNVGKDPGRLLLCKAALHVRFADDPCGDGSAWLVGA